MSEQKAATTADGRYIVIDGRKWRATDPAIPDPLRTQLVRQLMSARRAVKDRRDDPDAVARARRGVDDAKVALGERGHPWWEPADEQHRKARIGATIRTLLRDRQPPATLCPSEVARAVGQPEWRRWMDEVRDVGRQLAAEGVIEITQSGELADRLDPPGPIRYRAGRKLETVT